MGVDNPDWATATMQDGWTPVSEDELDVPPTIAQKLAVGPVQNRTIDSLQIRTGEVPVRQPKRVEITGACDGKTGKMVFSPASNDGQIYPSDLTKVSLEEAGQLDTAEVQRSLPTARKGGAARTHWPTSSHS